MFLDGPDAKARDAVHVVFAGKKVRDEYPGPVPNIELFVPRPLKPWLPRLSPRSNQVIACVGDLANRLP